MARNWRAALRTVQKPYVSARDANPLFVNSHLVRSYLYTIAHRALTLYKNIILFICILYVSECIPLPTAQRLYLYSIYTMLGQYNIPVVSGYKQFISLQMVKSLHLETFSLKKFSKTNYKSHLDSSVSLID